MRRIQVTTARASESSRKLLIPYLVAGDPDLDTTLALIHACLAPRGLAPESVATFVLRAVSAP